MPQTLLILARPAPPLTAHNALPVPADGEPTLVLWDRRAHFHTDDPAPGLERRRRAPGSELVTRGFLLVHSAVHRSEVLPVLSLTLTAIAGA